MHVRLFLRPRLAIQDGPMPLQTIVNTPSTRRLGASVVWNFPISSTFSSTNAFGWPLVLTVVDRTLALRGYGAVPSDDFGKAHPVCPHVCPRSLSPLQEFLGWLVNAPAEFRIISSRPGAGTVRLHESNLGGLSSRLT